MKNPRRHNYFKLMMQLAAQIKAGEKGVIHVTFEHDDWCGIFKGGDCNCNPTARYGMPRTSKKA